MPIALENLEDWAEQSRQGKVCGILGCKNLPKVKCAHCQHQYCQEHAHVLYTPAHAEKEQNERT